MQEQTAWFLKEGARNEQYSVYVTVCPIVRYLKIVDFYYSDLNITWMPFQDIPKHHDVLEFVASEPSAFSRHCDAKHHILGVTMIMMRRALQLLLLSAPLLNICKAEYSRNRPQAFVPRNRRNAEPPPPNDFDDDGDAAHSSVLEDLDDIVSTFDQSYPDESLPEQGEYFDMDMDESSHEQNDYDDYKDELASSPRDDERMEEKGLLSGENKGALYDAYNQLHTLAQDFRKPFDAPAVVVVGHQSSGKSALIEALMGFQFNQVGGGTKTRRPIALRMQYNPECTQPRCYLVGEDGVERHMSLSDIQDYIEKENKRLERDPLRSFDSREINVRMEYKYCPNMILIDTPGLIAAPRVPKGRNGAGAAFQQQRALQASAREAEKLVVEKMGCQDYIILCVEDTADWKHGATREIVQKADPDLSRTVIVNTKLDTKIPQFGTPSDVNDFIKAKILDRICPNKLGGPFYTSVPSGRVARPGHDSNDSLFDSDEEFVEACAGAEQGDKALVMQRLKRLGKAGEHAAIAANKRVGIRELRTFLEERVDESYRRNVAKIIPMLQAEYTSAERRLKACEKELEAISVDRLKAGADVFCDQFCVCLKKSLQGSVVAPASLFGETLAQETAIAGSFHDVQGAPISVSERTWDRLIDVEVGNKEHRLYGGSQYHRTLREFHLASKCLRLPTITEDEIANAAGVGEIHDGVNFLHAACVIALEKARVSFEPLLEALRVRVTHAMDRLCPVTEYMLRETGERAKISTQSFREEDGDGSFKGAADISQNPQFQQLIRNIFEKFVAHCSRNAMSKCHDDLTSITRYVTWNLNERGSGALSRSLPDQTDLVAVYKVAIKASKKGGKDDGADSGEQSRALTQSDQTLTPVSGKARNRDRDYTNLLQIMEEAACSRDSNRTNMVISGLVQHIVAQWRESFCRTVTMKFNCYFMLPFVEEFHKFLRDELRKVYEGEDLNDVFDLSSARRALQQQREQLQRECDANKKLQEHFEGCARLMRKQQDALYSSAMKESFEDTLPGKGSKWP